MAMELLIVFALNREPTLDAWQKELDAKHAAVRFLDEVELKRHRGFLPLTLEGKKRVLLYSGGV